MAKVITLIKHCAICSGFVFSADRRGLCDGFRSLAVSAGVATGSESGSIAAIGFAARGIAEH